MRLSNRYFLGVALLLAITAGQSRAEDQIRTYTVPKEQASAPPAASANPAPDLPVNSSPIRWTLPFGWVEGPPRSMRIASFDITGAQGGKAEMAVTSFPGPVGTELGNVNRWRRELNLPPIQEGEIVSQPVIVDSNQGKLFTITEGAQETVVAMVPQNGATWFFKLHGDAPTVSAAQPGFHQFLDSVRFAGATNAPPPEQPIATDAGGGDAPRWNVPPNWSETSPGPMIFKSFAVTDNGAKAMVTVSFFPGAVGGVLANINRWRGQLGLPPVEEADLGGVAQPVTGADGTATLVDFSGKSKADEPARLVAAIVPHGENTWFYKLIGDPAAVAREKEGFVNFVKSVHYP